MNNWKQISLGSIYKIVGGGTPNMDKPEYWQNGTIPWVSPKDMKLRELWASSDYITEIAIKESSTNLLPIESVLIVTRSGILRNKVPIALTKVKLTINQDIKAFLPNEKIIPAFFADVLSFNEKRILKKCSKVGTTVESLNLDSLKAFEISLPPLDEQKKIAEILSTWDKSIETTEKLIAAKQNLKKSLMQRLLTGSQRFPEFHGQEWTKYKIADLFEEVARYVKWSDEHSYKLVSIRRRFKGLFPRGDFFGHQIGVKKLKSIHSEDFLISKRQVSHGAWGVVTPEFHDTKVSDEYDSLIVKDKTKINVDFWGWLCKTPQMQRYSYLSSNGVHIEKLIFDFNDFRKRSIYVPSSIEEQKKIAAVLENCDAEINVLQNKLAALRQQKRGLMQKLLTGRVRVKVDENSVAPV